MYSSAGLVNSVYSSGEYNSIDIKEAMELHELLCQYYTRITGKIQGNQDNLILWYEEQLSNTQCKNKNTFLMRIARTLERNSSNKEFILTNHSIMGIGLDN